MISLGAQVEHAEFGIGRVVAILGATATVEFFGEKLNVDVHDLVVRAGGNGEAALPTTSLPTTDVAFRRSFEAVNLGVVPALPDQLVKFTIGGDTVSDEIRRLLQNAPLQEACRIFMGYYVSGKSHHLRLAKASALGEGWVTTSFELDPKAADRVRRLRAPGTRGNSRQPAGRRSQRGNQRRRTTRAQPGRMSHS